jgi:uncharacterized protein (TIGR03086 family)
MGALEDFDGARQEFARLVAMLKVSDLDAATPCSEWDVRLLLNHVVTGTQWFTAVILDEPHPDRSIDQIGSDPVGAFAKRADEYRAAMFAPGALEKSYHHAVGDVTGERYNLMRVDEYLCHGWDLATTLGASPNFDDELAGRCLTMLELQLEGRPREVGKGFGVAVDQLEASSNYERLIAFAGRNATDW